MLSGSKSALAWVRIALRTGVALAFRARVEVRALKDSGKTAVGGERRDREGSACGCKGFFGAPVDWMLPKTQSDDRLCFQSDAHLIRSALCV